MPRHNPVCLDCWQTANPDRYAPVAHGFTSCAACGWDSMVIHVSPDMLAKIKRGISEQPCEYCGEKGCTL